jgi:GAF domain-containing protein
MVCADAALEFDICVDATLQASCEVARDLIGARRAAMSLTLAGDCADARKYFSLTEDYQIEAAEPHPRLRGLLAVPIVGQDAVTFGLLRVSDKVDGTDFDEYDERRLQRLAALAALAFDGQVTVRRLRGGEEVPLRGHERMEAR